MRDVGAGCGILRPVRRRDGDLSNHVGSGGATFPRRRHSPFRSLLLRVAGPPRPPRFFGYCFGRVDDYCDHDSYENFGPHAIVFLCGTSQTLLFSSFFVSCYC
jgi:hypothetical protein